MAETLAQMFIGDILKQNEKRDDTAALWNSAANVAEIQIKKEKQAAEIAKAQQDLTNHRIEQFHKDLMEVTKYKDPLAQKNYMKMMKARREVWGLQELYSDETMDALLIPEEFGKHVTMAREVQNPKSPYFGKPELAMKTMNDPVKRAGIVSTPSEAWGDKPDESADINKAFNQYLNRQNELVAAGQKAEGTQGRFDEGKQIDLTKELIKNKIPQVGSMMSKVNNLVPGGLDGWKDNSALPGFEGMDSRRPINELKGNALKLRQAAEGVKNLMMAQVSGQNVTADEAVRVMAMIGMVPSYDQNGILKDFTLKGTGNKAAFVNGMRQIRDMFDGVMNTYRAGYGNNFDVVMTRMSKGKQASIVEPNAAGGRKTTTNFYGRNMTAEGLKSFAAKTKNKNLKNQALSAAAELEKGQ